MSTIDAFRRFEVRRETLLWAALVLNTELLLFGAYYTLTPDRLGSVAVLQPTSWITAATPLLPLVWINVGIWAVVRTDPPAAPQRRRTVALAVATAYFGLLAYFGGLWGLPDPTLPMGPSVSLFTAPPGWAPRVFVNTPVFRVHLLPYKVVGYTALAYLVYAAVLEAAGSAVSGVVGLLSCVSCTWPILATLVAGVAGGSTAMAEAAIGFSYPISTAVFVLTVALLYWRPGWR